jgi:hypothetical protein
MHKLLRCHLHLQNKKSVIARKANQKLKVSVTNFYYMSFISWNLPTDIPVLDISSDDERSEQSEAPAKKKGSEKSLAAMVQLLTHL